MKLGSKNKGKKVYQKLLKDIDQHKYTKKTLSKKDFFDLQKFLNQSRTVPRILNKTHFKGDKSMQWKQQILNGVGGYKTMKVVRKANNGV